MSRTSSKSGKVAQVLSHPGLYVRMFLSNIPWKSPIVLVSFWFKPDAEPVKSRAMLSAKMDVGGMFLEQRFDGKFGPEMGNKPWTSLSYTGFNPKTGQYEAVRMASSHSTMIVVRGKAKPDGSIELAGEYMFMGGKATERDVIRHEGADKCIIECWMSFGGVPEFKGAEMVLTRVKQ